MLVSMQFVWELNLFIENPKLFTKSQSLLFLGITTSIFVN